MNISFYSYKGGVGRTQAMINLGLELVRRGKSVGLIDVDLEAPGIHHILEIKPEQGQSLIEYLIDQNHLSLEKRIIEINEIKGKTLKQSLNATDIGKLVLFPSIADHEKLSSISNKIVKFFVPSVKKLKNIFGLDFILMDSRTGYARFTSLTLQCADIYAFITRLDSQNAQGMREFMKMTKNKKRLLIASQVPFSNRIKQLREVHIKKYEKLVDSSIDYIIPFDDRMLFGDRIPILDFGTDCPINKVFKDIADRIEEMAK